MVLSKKFLHGKFFLKNNFSFKFFPKFYFLLLSENFCTKYHLAPDPAPISSNGLKFLLTPNSRLAHAHGFRIVTSYHLVAMKKICQMGFHLKFTHDKWMTFKILTFLSKTPTIIKQILLIPFRQHIQHSTIHPQKQANTHIKAKNNWTKRKIMYPNHDMLN